MSLEELCQAALDVDLLLLAQVVVETTRCRWSSKTPRRRQVCTRWRLVFQILARSPLAIADLAPRRSRCSRWLLASNVLGFRVRGWRIFAWRNGKWRNWASRMQDRGSWVGGPGGFRIWCSVDQGFNCCRSGRRSGDQGLGFRVLGFRFLRTTGF